MQLGASFLATESGQCVCCLLRPDISASAPCTAGSGLASKSSPLPENAHSASHLIHHLFRRQLHSLYCYRWPCRVHTSSCFPSGSCSVFHTCDRHCFASLQRSNPSTANRAQNRTLFGAAAGLVTGASKVFRPSNSNSSLLRLASKPTANEDRHTSSRRPPAHAYQF